MVMLLQKNRFNEDYYASYSKILNKNITRNELEDFLKRIENSKFEYFKNRIRKKQFYGKTINFINSQSNKIIDKITEAKNFTLEPNEVASGIDLLQDYVNKKHKEILGDVKIGDGIFNLNQKEYNSLCLSDKEKSIVKPFYTTKELHSFWGNRMNSSWVIYTNSEFKDEEKIKFFPNIKRHLDKFIPVLTSVNKPYGLHRARDEKFFKGEKVFALRKCSKEPTFTYVNFDAYVNRTFLIIKTNRINQKHLTAILNSELIAFWLKYKGKMQGDNYQIDKEPLLDLPLFKSDKPDLFVRIVDYIIFLKSQPSDKMSFYFEQVIDGMVYELYFENEIKQAGCEILKYLDDLPEIKDENLSDNRRMEDEEKMKIITKVFNKLYDKESPVRKNLFFMDSVEEVAIIKKSLEK